MASTAARATASLSATTMMPLLMSEGGRLKVAIGTSASCASATTTRAGVAVVGGQDDAVGALRDAVLDLLELPVGVVPAVELDHLDAGVLQRLDDGAVTGDPEAGREILEGVADGGAFLAPSAVPAPQASMSAASETPAGLMSMFITFPPRPGVCPVDSSSSSGFGSRYVPSARGARGASLRRARSLPPQPTLGSRWEKLFSLHYAHTFGIVSIDI